MSAAASPDTGPTDAALAPRRAWAGLVLLLLPMLTLASDLTVLFFAVPTLSADLQPTSTQALWIVHAYGFLIASFLVTMGRLGDRIGPRRLMLTGAAAFAALSLAAAFADSAEVLIGLRAALGIAGATLMPSLFSLLRVMFADETQRRLAIAVMFSGFSAGGAIGPLLGGALLEHFWWGAVFLVNLPPMLLLVVLGPRLLPERRDLDRAPLDVPSVVLSVTGMLAVVFGLQELAAGTDLDGITWLPVGVAVGGIAVLAAFVRRQRRRSDPLFDLALLADRGVAVALATLLLVGVGVVGTFFLFTQHLQWVAQLSPLQAGLWTLPYIGANILGALLAPPLAARWQPATVVVLGLAVVTTGVAALVAVVGVGASLPWLVAAVSLSAAGQGAAMALLSDLIISTVPAERTGSAAAAQEVGGELGAALGIAAGGVVGLVGYRLALPDVAANLVPASVLDDAAASIHDGYRVAGEHPDLLAAVHEAVGRGLQAYAGVAAVLVAVTAVVVTLVLVRGTGRASPA